MSDDEKDSPRDESPGQQAEGSGKPGNAFDERFLRRLGERDEPTTALAAETAGPWTVREGDGGFEVVRQSEARFSTVVPVARFERRELAYLAAAVLPALGSSAALLLAAEQGPEGFAVVEDGKRCGHFQHFDEPLLASMNLVYFVLTHPGSHALLLHAAGATALELAGREAAAMADDEG